MLNRVQTRHSTAPLAGRSAVRTALRVADRLAGFVCEQRRTGLPEMVLHEAKRLLLNQLKASAEAAQQPAGVALLAQRPVHGTASARVWWSNATASPAQAAALNGRLLGLLDFGDTHLPSLGQFTAAILPPLLAQADAGGHAGQDVLEALALGLEVDIACAGSAVPGPLGLGARAACCTLLGLDRPAVAAALAELSDATMLAHEPGAGWLHSLGEHWRLQEIALHCRPLPVQALAPVEAVLALRSQVRVQELRLMQLTLSPQAWRLLQTQAPSAADDLRRSMAAAWLLGQFTSEERDAACWDSPAIRALAARIELLLDTCGTGIEACSLSVYFEDGSNQHTRVDSFLGSVAQPLSDSQLSELFRSAADDLVLPRRSGEIIHALWGLDGAPDIRALLGLLRRT
jgi:2-methylcitrate dehydratase PrpD